MAWKRLPDPYDKYTTPEDPQYSSADLGWVLDLQGPTLSQSQADAIFAQWNSQLGTAGSTGGSKPGGSTGGTIDYKKLIESDPYYLQAKADMSANSISDASQRAAMIRKTLIDWGVIPDIAAAGDKLGLSSAALGYLSSDVDERTKQLAAQNEAEGLSVHSRLGKANEDNIRAIRNALAARGMYESGELPYGLTENAQQYKQAATDAERQVLGGIEEVSGRFAQSERERGRALAEAMQGAAERALKTVGSSGGSTAPGGSTAGPGGSTYPAGPSGTANFTLPANTASVWDVNTASTYDAINAAKASKGSITIRPDDPEAIVKANAAAQAGVPVSIQVNGVGDDTPETLAARVAQYQQQFPGASLTLDLETPNFRGYAGTPEGARMEQYAQQVMAVAGNSPIIITTEGIADFNYSAWASNPNVIFAPQAYNGDMSPRDVSYVVSLLTSQGIPADRIIPVVAPGQDLGSYTGPVSVYGAPSGSGGIPQTNAPQPAPQPALNPPSTGPIVGTPYTNAVQAAIAAGYTGYVHPTAESAPAAPGPPPYYAPRPTRVFREE